MRFSQPTSGSVPLPRRHDLGQYAHAARRPSRMLVRLFRIGLIMAVLALLGLGVFAFDLPPHVVAAAVAGLVLLWLWHPAGRARR